MSPAQTSPLCSRLINPLVMMVRNPKNRKQERFMMVTFSPQGGDGDPAASGGPLVGGCSTLMTGEAELTENRELAGGHQQSELSECTLDPE